MTPDQVLAVSLCSASIGAMMRLLKKERFSEILDTYGLPPVPKMWIPWLSLGLGLLGGFAASLEQGTTWQQALSNAFMGLLSGALPVAAHQGIVEGVRGGKEFFAGPSREK